MKALSPLSAALVGVMLLASCSSIQRSSATGPTVTGPKATTASSGTLPGETINIAIDRILVACMDGLHETDFVMMEVEENGVRRPSRAYKDTCPESTAHYEECRQKALAAVPIPAQTKDDLRATHERLSKIVACVRKAGFDLGTMISADEYVANGGAPDGSLTSRWNQFDNDPAFGQSFRDCSALYPPSVTKP